MLEMAVDADVADTVVLGESALFGGLQRVIEQHQPVILRICINSHLFF